MYLHVTNTKWTAGDRPAVRKRVKGRSVEWVRSVILEAMNGCTSVPFLPALPPPPSLHKSFLTAHTPLPLDTKADLETERKDWGHMPWPWNHTPVVTWQNCRRGVGSKLDQRSLTLQLPLTPSTTKLAKNFQTNSTVVWTSCLDPTHSPQLKWQCQSCKM